MDVEAFGKKVRDKRADQRWSQEELAKRIGISRTYLSQIERGVAQNPSWRLIEQLTTILGLSPSEVFGQKHEWSELPPGLSEFARKADVSPENVEMLSKIHYGGQRPTRSRDWELIYKVIKWAAVTR